MIERIRHDNLLSSLAAPLVPIAIGTGSGYPFQVLAPSRKASAAVGFPLLSLAVGMKNLHPGIFTMFSYTR